MAQPINPSDVSYFVLAEATAGTLPTSGAWIPFPHRVGGAMPQLTAENVKSTLLNANRAGNGARKLGYQVSNGLTTDFKRGAHIALMLKSALSSGAPTAGVYKAGNTDTSFSIEKRMKKAASTDYHRFIGCQVSKFTLKCEASGIAEAAFDFIGLDRTTGTAVQGTTTYGTTSASPSLAGLDVTNFTVAGLTAVFRELELTVEHQREAFDQFGSASSFAVGTGGQREVMLKATFYREDLSADVLFAKSDAPVAVSFNIGSGADGFTVSLPRVNVSIPEDAEDGAKMTVTLTFTAQNDTVTGTDISITELT